MLVEKIEDALAIRGKARPLGNPALGRDLYPLRFRVNSIIVHGRRPDDRPALIATHECDPLGIPGPTGIEQFVALRIGRHVAHDSAVWIQLADSPNGRTLTDEVFPIRRPIAGQRKPAQASYHLGVSTIRRDQELTKLLAEHAVLSVKRSASHPRGLIAGFHIYTMKTLSGRKPDIADLFKGFNFFLHSLVASLLIGFFTFLGVLALIIPGLVIAAMYKFTYLFIVDKRMEFWPAMQASHNVVKNDYFGFTMFLILAFIVNVLGFLCLIVGLLVTVPVTFAAITIAYKELVGFDQQTLDAL
jgi:hypothetical protein